MAENNVFIFNNFSVRSSVLWSIIMQAHKDGYGNEEDTYLKCLDSDLRSRKYFTTEFEGIALTGEDASDRVMYEDLYDGSEFFMGYEAFYLWDGLEWIPVWGMTYRSTMVNATYVPREHIFDFLKLSIRSQDAEKGFLRGKYGFEKKIPEKDEKLKYTSTVVTDLSSFNGEEYIAITPDPVVQKGECTIYKAQFSGGLII